MIVSIIVETFRQRIQKLLQNKNFVRAAVVYGTFLLIGVVGFVVWFFIVGGSAGWYFLTCFPGFGSGIALAFLNNGHKKPVTFKSATSTVVMSLLITVIVYFLSGGEVFPVFIGLLLSFIGSALGLWFCRYEAGDVAFKFNTQEENSQEG